MAVVYEEKVVTETKKIAVCKTCDLCGKKSPRPWDDNWERSSYQVDKVTISVTVKHEKGTSYPEGSNLEVFEPAICPECFEGKVLPALRAAGIEVEYKDHSW